MMIINIPTSKEKIFMQYLTIINGVLSKEKKLTGIEISVLDKLLYVDYLYKHLTKENRDSILFHQETKKRMVKSLSISKASFDNILSKLRKKGMIKGQSLVTRVPIVNNKIELGFRLEIEDGQ